MSELIVEIVGKNIAEQRKKIKLSQKELAAKLNITHDAMSRMERGKMAPKMSRLQDIATALQCTVSSLFQAASPSIQERALAIAETLEKLPEEQQNAVLKVLYATIEGFESKKD